MAVTHELANAAWKAGKADRDARRAEEYQELLAWWTQMTKGGRGVYGGQRSVPLTAEELAKKARLLRLQAKDKGTWEGSAGQKARRKTKFGTDSPTAEQRSIARANARNQGTAGMVGIPAGGKANGGKANGGKANGGHAEGSQDAREGLGPHLTMRERYMKRKAAIQTKRKTKHRLSTAK